MPVYEYNCDECGPFTKLRGFDQSSAPANCPECGVASPKMFSVINLRVMRLENRTAWERNERSANAPHVCGAGCSHGHGKLKPHATTPGAKPTLQASGKRNSRPWMLGH
jgi:putative FmdB family regulatory protein